MAKSYRKRENNAKDKNPQLTRCVPPNQSLKLTEPAVDDLTRAKQPVTCWT